MNAYLKSLCAVFGVAWTQAPRALKNKESGSWRLLNLLGLYSPLLAALPRDGVPIGYRISQALKAPLDVFVARKLGSPGNPEFGVGSVAPGILFWNEQSLDILGLKPSDMKEIIAHEEKELNRRLRFYRGSVDFPNVTKQTVILVDDGIAMGVTIGAAIQGIQRLKPRKLILAFPVAPFEMVEELGELVDEFVCLETPQHFYAIGAFYRNFTQVSDEEVIMLLSQVKRNN